MNINKYLTLEDPKIKKNKSLLFLLILFFLSVVINFNARLYEKNVWLENPAYFSVEGVPMVRTGDPALYLKMAQYLKRNESLDNFYNKTNYPNVSEKSKPPLISLLPSILGTSKNVDTPLISLVISYLAQGPSLEEIVNAGNFLVLTCSVITAIGIFYLFFSIGRPFEGIIASIGGGISTHYLGRSSFGYIDTDILNLFFMYFLFGIIYLASKKQSWYKNTVYIIFAGLVGKLFYLWYPKPELIYLSFFSLAFFTTVHTKDWKKIIFNCVLYIILTNPIIFFSIFELFIANPYLSGYLSANIQLNDLVNTTQLNFNDIFRYIGEQQKPPLIELFKLEGSLILGIFCFIGITLWGITNPYKFIGFSPLILFFLLSSILGTRALFYSQPFLWFGLGYMVNFVILKFCIYQKIFFNNSYIYSFLSVCLLIFTIIINNPFTKDINRTLIPQPLTKAFIEIKDLVTDTKQSVIVVPWSYGYQSLLYNDIPVLIHNGMPTSPRHYFIDRAYTAHDLNETSKILNYVAKGNVEKINEKKINSFADLSKDLYSSSSSDDDIYILVAQHQRKFMAMSGEVAYWDIEKNEPYNFGEEETAAGYFNILEINCEDLDTITFTTKCAKSEESTEYNIPVNLALGIWDGKPVLKRVVQIADGKIEINEEYKNSQGNIVFQIVKNTKDNTSNLYFMHEAAFNSAYNKLFHLNLSENYELVYDDYPNAKIYKIN